MYCCSKIADVQTSNSPNSDGSEEIKHESLIDYDRTQVMSKGRFGAIFKGRYKDQDVAVKRIEILRVLMNEREEQALQELKHENVVTLLYVESNEDFK